MAKTIERYLSKLSGAVGGSVTIADGDKPTEIEIRALAGRRQELRAGLAPGAPNRIAVAALKLFDGWPGVRMDEAKAADTGLTYGRQIENFPLWAVEQAVSICQGWNTPFPPSSGQFRAVVAQQVVNCRAELRQIERILSAQIVKPEKAMDAEQREKLRALLAELGVKIDHRPETAATADYGLTKRGAA